MDKWQDWANFALGLWVIVSPWSIQHIMASPGTPGDVTEAAMWNHYVIGLAVIIIAIIALFAWRAWQEWTNVLLGVWLAISPWALGYSSSAGLMWNAAIAGLLVVLFAGSALLEGPGSQRAGT